MTSTDRWHPYARKHPKNKPERNDYYTILIELIKQITPKLPCHALIRLASTTRQMRTLIPIQQRVEAYKQLAMERMPVTINGAVVKLLDWKQEEEAEFTVVDPGSPFVMMRLAGTRYISHYSDIQEHLWLRLDKHLSMETSRTIVRLLADLQFRNACYVLHCTERMLITIRIQDERTLHHTLLFDRLERSESELPVLADDGRTVFLWSTSAESATVLMRVDDGRMYALSTGSMPPVLMALIRRKGDTASRPVDANIVGMLRKLTTSVGVWVRLGRSSLELYIRSADEPGAVLMQEFDLFELDARI